MKVIVGLGNPGSKYINTRHNLGFRVVSKLADRYKVKLKKKIFSKAKEARCTVFNKKLVLVQPLTFMNLSGNCVREHLNNPRISIDDLLIVCDDINLNLGQIRIRPQGSDGGHNGLESIIRSLGTKDFSRVRIGIRPEKFPADLSDYVLSDFTEDEISRVEESILKSCDACEDWIRSGVEKAMNVYNK
ncbi:MAG: aminoacyl-tRNA hydrolase [Candidatus Omnitrophota bacterium]